MTSTPAGRWEATWSVSSQSHCLYFQENPGIVSIFLSRSGNNRRICSFIKKIVHHNICICLTFVWHFYLVLRILSGHKRAVVVETWWLCVSSSSHMAVLTGTLPNTDWASHRACSLYCTVLYTVLYTLLSYVTRWDH